MPSFPQRLADTVCCPQILSIHLPSSSPLVSLTKYSNQTQYCQECGQQPSKNRVLYCQQTHANQHKVVHYLRHNKSWQLYSQRPARIWPFLSSSSSSHDNFLHFWCIRPSSFKDTLSQSVHHYAHFTIYSRLQRQAGTNTLAFNRRSNDTLCNLVCSILNPLGSTTFKVWKHWGPTQ